MIRFDGYYVSEPRLFEPREGFTNNYYVSAYCFHNSKVKSVSKYTKDKNDVFFRKGDFEKDFTEHCYQINQNEISLIYKCEDAGGKFYYEIINKERIKNRLTGKILKFVPWDDYGK